MVVNSSKLIIEPPLNDAPRIQIVGIMAPIAEPFAFSHIVVRPISESQISNWSDSG